VSAPRQAVSAHRQVVSAHAQVVSTQKQIRHQAASPTSRHANSDHFSFAEPDGSDGSDGSDGADVSTSRPSNAPGRANRYAPNQNADALRSCSCKTLTLPMVSPPSTQTQQLLRRAWGRPVFHLDPARCPTRILLAGRAFKHRRLHIIQGF